MKNRPHPHFPIVETTDLKAVINRGAREYADRPAVSMLRSKTMQTHTYSRLGRDVEALGSQLFHLGIQGEKVALLGENSYEWIVVMFAVMNGMNVLVPVDKELSTEGMRHVLKDSGATVLFYSAKYAAHLAELCEGTDVRTTCKMDTELEQWIAAGNSLLDNGYRCFIEKAIDVEETIAIFYTSGTTGPPKGVMLTHKNFATELNVGLAMVQLGGNSFAVLPFHHAFGITVSVMANLHTGSHICISNGMRYIKQELQAFRPRNTVVVPLFVEGLYKQVWAAVRAQKKEKAVKGLIIFSRLLLRLGIDLRRRLFRQVLAGFGGELEMVISGGAPLDPEYVQRYRDFGIHLLNGYGMTECSPVVGVNRVAHYRDGSVGMPFEGPSVARILRPDENGVGEIAIKSDIVMKGYYNRPEETAAVFEDGWLKSGDLGYMDEEGFIFITGRSKNLIILSSGKNISPEELELLVARLADVKEVVVRQEGDSIVAEVFPEYGDAPPPEQEKQQIQQRIRAGIAEINHQLPMYKVMEKVIFRDAEFEKNTSRKIKRGVRAN